MDNMLWIAAAVFFGGWIGWAVTSRIKGGSWTIALGGGFLVGCLALIAVIWMVPAKDVMSDKAAAPAVATEAKPQQAKNVEVAKTAAPAMPPVAYGPGLGRSYAQVVNGLDYFIPKMENAPLGTGEKRMMGTADQSRAMVVLEVVGNLPESVDRATLTVVPSPDSNLINLGNITAIGRFLGNACPAWPGAVNWVMDTINAQAKAKPKNGESPAAEKAHGDQKVRVTLLRDLGMIFITVSHKTAKL